MRRLLCLALLGAAGCSSGNYVPQDDAALPPPPGGPKPVYDLASRNLFLHSPETVPTATRLIFRRVEGDNAGTTNGDAVNQTGAVPATSSSDRGHVYLTSHEITQPQWRALAQATASTDDDEPWLDVDDNGVFTSSSVGDDYPAYGVTFTQATTVLTAWSAGQRYRLRLPTAAEWEMAAHGGNPANRYSWGNSEALDTVDNFAVVKETAGTTRGARSIFDHSPSAFGLHDLHGNVAEWVSDGHLRGGSWNDNLRQAAAGNQRSLPPTIAYALAGLRLVVDVP